MIRRYYKDLPMKIKKLREKITTPLTLSEKVLYLHLYRETSLQKYQRGENYVNFQPDRVAMQDATAQMALLQFMQAGKKKASVPSTVHADHLIQAKTDSKEDLQVANITNKEVYDFLSSACNKYGISFWKPGAGIIHQVLLENYAFPGGMMIGTDSHTVNAGGLGMIAVGVGGADAVDVMAGMAWELKFPKIIGVKLKGKLRKWTSAKDIILKIAGELTVKGGTGAIIEYFGEGADSLSCTGKGTICNMGAEVGATTSIFAYDVNMEKYLQATGREEIAKLANEVKNDLQADPEIYQKPEKYYNQLLEIDLDILEPHLNGPFTPDRATPVSQMKKEVVENAWPQKVEWGLIGSCTNSSYEDLSRAASIAQQAIDKNLEVKAQFGINPGSELVRYTAERDGLLKIFEKLKAKIFTNACGPCIGQWNRAGADKQKVNSIVHSFNRNFAKRNDGNPNTHAFVTSPEMVAAIAISGKLDFNPQTDSLVNRDGQEVTLDFPQGDKLPKNGFAVEDNGYQAPASDGSGINVIISPNSNRLQILKKFSPWNGKDIKQARLLIKVKGKCTTDHISMAGSWLKYRGHLDNISNNLLMGAINAFNQKANSVKGPEEVYQAVSDSARAYKSKGIDTIIIGDDNYGEGSSREHAAMQPRYLGVKAVIVKSFARIHETNLKKQGMLAFTFENPDDYEKINEDDSFDIIGLKDFSPQKKIILKVYQANNKIIDIVLKHSFNHQQIAWFKAGSALNLIRSQNG